MEAQFRAYLRCGILAHGFARARCSGCGHDFLVAFSCKGRGICPSCNSRRMAATAAHLTDHVIPTVPVRRWMLSVPKRLRHHLCVLDGVYEASGEEGEHLPSRSVRFHEATGSTRRPPP